MAKVIINNGDTGLEARNAINGNFTELYGSTITTEWYEEIGSGTGGTLTPPAGSTILLNQWASGVDALASTMEGVSGLPTFETPVTAAGVPITATLTEAGAWTLSGTPSSYPVSIIYVYKIPAVSADGTKTLSGFSLYDDKLDAKSGIYAGLKETQVLTHSVTGAGQTITLDYALGQTQYLNITTDDAFTIAFSNWPTTEAGFMTLIVDVALGVTVGAVTWPTLNNTAPDFTGITADTGEGVYTLFYGNSAYRIYVVEES